MAEVVSLETALGVLDDCYRIRSFGNADFGTSTFDYWFHRQYGIVKMLYRNYEEQLLQIDLIEVIDG